MPTIKLHRQVAIALSLAAATARKRIDLILAIDQSLGGCRTPVNPCDAVVIARSESETAILAGDRGLKTVNSAV